MTHDGILENQGDFVTVGRFHNVANAAFYQSVLEANGIQAFIQHEHTAALGAPVVGMAPRVRLQTAADDAREAIALLERANEAPDPELAAWAESHADAGENADAPLDYEPPPAPDCPYCGSNRVEQALRIPFLPLRVVMALVSLVLGVVAGYRERRSWRCRDCGWDWRE